MSARPASTVDNSANRYVDRDHLHAAKKALSDIEYSITELLSSKDSDIDDLIRIFRAIKDAGNSQQFDLLEQEAPGALHRLSGQLAALLNRICVDIDSGSLALESLAAGEVHTFFNGLAAIIGESSGNLLLLREDMETLGDTLQDITSSLLNHARSENMERDQWNNSQLINVLNWISRGLKRQLLSPDTPVIRAFFNEALLTMKDWGSASDATNVVPLDTRQLGKCMVQIATAMKYELIDTNAPADLLGELVLGLCGGDALDRCTAWQYRTQYDGSVKRLCVPTHPTGAELTNIGNTIKDCLQAGHLDISSPVVQTIISKLCTQMLNIPAETFALRGGQRLSNCCNFLRVVFEVEQLTTIENRRYQAAFEQLGAELLKQIPQVLQKSTTDHLSEQSITNLISFVKAMERTRKHDMAVLRAAATSLIDALPEVRGEIVSFDSMTAALGGLQHFAMRGFIREETAVALMLPLLGNVEPTELDAWPEQARATLMRAAVYCHRTAGEPMAILMQTLFNRAEAFTDRLPYLKAACVLAAREEGWIAGHQPILRRLLPKLPAGMISAEDLQRAVIQQRAMELDKNNERLAEIQALPGTPQPTQPAQERGAALPTKATQKNQAVATGDATKGGNIGMPRHIETRVSQSAREPESGKNQMKKTQKTTMPPIPASPAAASSPRLNTTGWQPAKRTTKRSADAASTVKPATTPIHSEMLTWTEPKLNTDKKSGNTSGTSPASGKSASSKKSGATPATKADKPAKTTQSKSPDKHQTPTQEWFSLLDQGSRLSATQFIRLKALVAAHPELVDAVDGTGAQAHSALFYALFTGKPDATTMIVRSGSKKNLATTLKQVFDELVFIDDTNVVALGACLESLTAGERQTLRQDLEKLYPPGELERTLAEPLLESLKDHGIVFDPTLADIYPKVEMLYVKKLPHKSETNGSVVEFAFHVNLRKYPFQYEPIANKDDTTPNRTAANQPSSLPKDLQELNLAVTLDGSRVVSMRQLLAPTSATDPALVAKSTEGKGKAGASPKSQ